MNEENTNEKGSKKKVAKDNTLVKIQLTSKPLKVKKIEEQFSITLKNITFLETNISKNECSRITFKDMEQFYVFLDRMFIDVDNIFYKETEQELFGFLEGYSEYNFIVFFEAVNKHSKSEAKLLYDIMFPGKF